VTLLRKRSELPSALAHALAFSRGKKAVLEEFVEGREFSVETLSVHGHLHVLQITEKETTGPPHFVESGHSQPAELAPDDRRAVEEATRKAASALGIETGPTHTELKLCPQGPMLIEVGARLGGDYITSDLVPLSTGIDMLALSLDLALGADVVIPEGLERGAAIRYFYPKAGKVIAVEGVEKCSRMEGVVRVEVFKGPGEEIVPVTGSHERAGYAIARATSASKAIRIAETCRNRVRFVLE
jgi:biotin carboxylase